MSIPSIAMIPSGYKANKVYSVLPTDGSGDLVTARTSTATRINQNGLIEEVLTGVPRLDYTDGGCPSLLLEGNSTNLITESEAFGKSYWTKSGASIQSDASTAGSEKVVNGDFATDSDWTKGTGWVIGSGAATHTGATGNLLQNIGISGKSVLVTFNILSIADGVVNVFDNSVSTAALFSFSTTGIKTFYLNQTGNEIGFRTNSTSVSIDNVSVKEVSGFSAPSVDSPLGAFKLVEDTSNGLHWIESGSGSSLAGDLSSSIRVKADGISKIGIRESRFSGDYATFNLTTGTVIDNSAGDSVNIKSLANNWYEISVVADGNVSGHRFGIYLLDNSYTTGSPSSYSYTGDGTSGLYIFGAQVEEQSSATSYIPTAGTTISRTADSASKSGISSLINSSEGVLFVEMSALSNDGTFRNISLSDGTSSQAVRIYFRSSANQITVLIDSSLGGGATVNVTDALAFNKIAVQYKENDVRIFVNGSLEATISSVSMPIGLNELSLDIAGSLPFYGNVKDLRVYKTALTDSELTTLTTI